MRGLVPFFILLFIKFEETDKNETSFTFRYKLGS
jgi:hypothetical protein